MRSQLALALAGCVLCHAVEFNCDDYHVYLPSNAEHYKDCPSLDNYVTIKAHDNDEVRIEGFASLTGNVVYKNHFAKTLWCDANVIGNLQIENAANLESLVFPNLTTIESISITNADDLKRIHAPKLRTISHWLSLTNVSRLEEFNITRPKQKADVYTDLAFNIGYVPVSRADIGGFQNGRDLSGNVVLSNVSQSLVDTLLANPAVSLPTVELRNSPLVHHVNHTANQLTNLTINGNGDTVLTLNGIVGGRNFMKGLYISGVKEINTDRKYVQRISVDQASIVDNPSMKEAALVFYFQHVLTIAHNPVLETVRFPTVGFPYGNPYSNYTIANNTKLRLSAMRSAKPSEDSTYRPSDHSIATFDWTEFYSKQLHLQGNFDMDLFDFDQQDWDSSISKSVHGDIVINSTATHFDCGKLDRLAKPPYSSEPGSSFICNGKAKLRVVASSSTRLSASHSIMAALICGIVLLLN